MMGFDDAAGMGMGLINSGIQAGLGAAQRKREKKLAEMDRQGKRDEYAFGQEELAQEGQQTQHQFANAEAASEGQANDRGVYNSTIPQGENTELEYQKKTRLDAMNRRRVFNDKNMAREEQTWKLQREMQRAQSQMNMISSILQQGAGGGLSAMGAH